jgi:DNA-binding transcriptional MerR regulator
MRMAELSRESGVPVATIKYYLREGLLPAGERTSPNQARYDESHVRRLKLVRAMLDVGGISIAGVAQVLAAIDDHSPTHGVLGIAQVGLPMPKTEVDDEARVWAADRLADIAAERGWDLYGEKDPVEESVIGILCTFRELGHLRLLDGFAHYAELADRLAEVDLGLVAGLPSTESIVESAVVGTVLGDALLAGLRRLAQQNASRRQFGES